MADLHGSRKINNGGGLTALMSSQEEFQEEEVWGHIHMPSKSNQLEKSKSGRPSWRRSSSVGPASSRAPPSEPVDFPDWAGILKDEWKPRKQWSDDEGGDVGDDVDDDEMLPPHELLARRDRKNRAAYSMCEGIGRTLKGRDLRNVRNAILAKTGFIEKM